MSEALVTVSVDRGVCTITLDSPHNRNALSSQLVAELADALRMASGEDAVRVIVLTHTGGTFCSGADLSEASADQPRLAPLALVGIMRAIVESRSPSSRGSTGTSVPAAPASSPRATSSSAATRRRSRSPRYCWDSRRR